MATAFDVYSTAPGGTVLMALCLPRGEAAPVPRPAAELGVACVPYPGEDLCGDSWAIRREGERSRVLVADGLGHGLHASEAAARAVHVFHERPDDPPVRLLEAMHAALRSTRGAAVAVADVDTASGRIEFCGVGNIAAAVVSAHGSRSFVSYNGIVGHELRKIQEFTLPWGPGAKLIMHSDGLVSRWSLAAHPGLAARRAAVVAATLYRDHRRGKDDVTVLVLAAAGAGG